MKKFLSAYSKKQIIIASSICVALLITTSLLFFSNENQKSTTYVEKQVNEAFNEYISAYTTGDISKNSKIRIRFIDKAIEDNLIGKNDDRPLLQFTPSIEGTTKWIDAYTLEFSPETWLKGNQVFNAKLDLEKLFKTSKELSLFEFNFHTYQQDFEVEIGDLITSSEDMKKVSLKGILNTVDLENIKDIESILTASQDGVILDIKWNHLGETEHEFTVNNITRKESKSEVTINWDGSSIDIDKKGSKAANIPALGDFYVLSCNAQVSPEQAIIISFTDPIDPNQELTGLITSEENVDFKFKIENNFITAYPNKKIDGSLNITVHSGIKNILNYKTKKIHESHVVFEQVKPAVRLLGKGVIVPSSSGLIFPFEAVSLKAVDITITEIFENNVIQFFQDNRIDGNYNLKRVARPIFKKSLLLNQNKLLNLNKWNRFSIDLADLITPTPGAIYQVSIDFRQSQSNYSCGKNSFEDELKPINENNWTADSYSNYSYWDYYEEDYEYDWSERENPCHATYYSSNSGIKRNIIASNLGIIAKIGKDNTLFCAVTDINTTQPLQDVNIEVYDFQQQPIASGKTNNEGFLTLPTDIKPFLIKATQGEDVNYLKVDNGSSLSLSNFNVGGSKVKQGIKGFIYGERGVWRPGDTLFMSFILEDKNKVLPKGHPVIFELRNPDGKLEDKIVKKSNLNGFYTYQPVTSEDAMTGGWRVKAKVGNTVFTERVKIETVKPNRLKINLDYNKEFLTVNDKNLSGDLEVKWLHGGIAKNLKTEFELVLTKAKTSFSKYESYIFEDQSRRFTPEIVKIFDGNLNEQGKAKVPTSISINGDAPGVLNAHFKGKVFEESGDFSIDQFTIPYYPYSSFVGIRAPEGDHRGMLLTDKKQPIDIVCLSPKGELKGTKYVNIEVYKLNWKWWWDQSSNSSSNYIGTNYRTPITTDRVKVIEGKGVYNLEINYPEWGRYYVKVTDPESKHAAGKIIYMDWPGWAGKAKRDLPDAASMLTFSSDKEEYSVGETMKLTIPGSGKGNALVSIENGTKVLESYWMPLKKGENQFDIAITNKMTPNVFVHVTALQPHAQTINDHPIRMYGVIPIDIVDKSTHLHPIIEMPKQLSPGKKVPIKVTEKDGKAMTFTVAVVDEGLLSLTNFKTPNPWPNFYKHEALGVNTWDIYKYVLGAYGGEIEKIIAPGGDGNIINKNDKKSKRFKPVIRYFGPYHIDVSGSKEISFIMPNYIGAVRTMVVAGYQGAYGNAEKETPVRQSLMVMGTLPRVLSPGEKLKLPVTVFAYDKNIGKTKVSIKANGPIKALETTKDITFSKEGDKIVYFDLEVAKAIGVSKVEIEAVSGNRKSTHVINIEVRNPNPVVSESFDKVLKPGETLEYSFKTLGMKGTNSYAIEASSLPPLNLSKRLKYLIRYPHGCIEQTTSAAFPQLYLGKLTDIDSQMENRIEINIKKAIERLSSFQSNNGGFSYWPSDNYQSPWGTNYAGHFLVMAKKKGYYVSNSIISNWKKYQRNKARNWTKSNRYNSELIQAYRLYTLALSGAPEKGAMNRLKEKPMNKASHYMLAAAYALTGREDIAKELIASAPVSVKKYREYWYTYGSSDRDEALLLLALNAIKRTEDGMIAVKKISERLNQKRWMSTQETAFSLLAIAEFLEDQPVSSTVNMDYKINGETFGVLSQYSFYNKELKESDLNSKKITIKNTSNGILYINLNSSGQPLVDKKQSSNEIIEMKVTYSDKNGNFVDLNNLEQNKDILVSVRIKNNGLRGDINELALTTLYPSGWEIQNTRMDVVADYYQSNKPDYQDYRDDRVYTYFDIKSGETKTFTFLINPSYSGKFTLPAINCEAMYDNVIKSYIQGGKTETVKK